MVSQWLVMSFQAGWWFDLTIFGRTTPKKAILRLVFQQFLTYFVTFALINI